MPKSKSINQFRKEVFNLVGNEYTVLSDNYINNKTKLKIKHNLCNSIYEVRPNDFLYGKRCPKCANKKRTNHLKKNISQFRKEVFDLVGDEYTVLTKRYKDNKTKVLFIHNMCNTKFYMRPNDFQQGYRCPECAKNAFESKPVRDIKLILQFLKIKYEQEVLFEECKDKRCLPFDFCIYYGKSDDAYFLLEYDGMQHFKGWSAKKSNLQKNQIHDRIKNKFCYEFNIPLYRINYKQDLLTELYKILIKYKLIKQK